MTKLLHWSMAFIIIYASFAGYTMHLLDTESTMHSLLSVLNMSLATIATPLLILRYLWTFFSHSPTLPSSIPTIQISIAKLVHSLLYVLMFVVFLSGYLMLTHAYSFFWITDLPNLIDNADINLFFFQVHRVACAALFFSVALHVLAVLKHQLIAKNNVLALMK